MLCVSESLHSHINTLDVVQLLSHVQFFVIPWTAAPQASLSFTVSTRRSSDLLVLLALMAWVPYEVLSASLLQNPFMCALLESQPCPLTGPDSPEA